MESEIFTTIYLNDTSFKENIPLWGIFNLPVTLNLSCVARPYITQGSVGVNKTSLWSKVFKNIVSKVDFIQEDNFTSIKSLFLKDRPF